MKIITLTLIILLLIRPALAQTNASSAVTVSPTDKNLRYVGRWARPDSANSHGNWIGSYVRVDFTGTSVGINLGGHSGLDVRLDGEPPRVVSAGPGVWPLNMAPLGPGVHTLLVGVKGGGGWDFRGLVLDPGAKTRSPVRRPLIEFVGDSITCGSPEPIEAAGNYTWQTAEALGCDHTQIAWPGRALTTGYGCADDKAGLDTQYFQQNCFYDSPRASWNFSAYTPQIVVINLGQNDACGNEPDNIFTASYIQFVKNIRAKFPRAQIVALRMFGGGHYGADTEKAVAALNAGDDARVHFIDTAGWLDSPADYVDGVHPNANGNRKVAVRLAPLLKPYLAGAKRAAVMDGTTVGDPAQPAGLPQALINAYVRGARRITITPGTYLLSNPGGALIHLSHWRDAVISAAGVTLIINNGAGAGTLFSLEDCDHVTLAGPVVSQTAQTAYQGHVLSIDASDPRHPTCIWRPSAGYPVPPDGTKELWINFVDAKTRRINTQAGDYYHAGLQPLGDGRYRIGLEGRPVRFHVGDYIVARYGNPPAKIHLTGSHDCTVKDFTMMRNGFAPIFEGEGGGNHYLRCHWALGPRPQGATEDPVVTNAADGLHSPDCDPGPDIEDCTFDGVFLDDCIAIHGVYNKIVSANGPIIVAHNGYAFYTVGEPVRLSNDHGFYRQATVTALKDNGDGTSTLTLGTSQAIPLDVCLSNPRHDGHGYKIIGCRLGNTRSRGIIVKSDDGLIQDNVITDCGLGLRIGPEWPSESDYSQHVVVTGNTLARNGDGIVVDGSGAKENRDITIRNNRLTANSGDDLNVAWASDVTITGNTFTASAARPSGGKPRPPITVRAVQNVTIRGNHITPSPAYAQPSVNIGDNVAQLTQDDVTRGH